MIKRQGDVLFIRVPASQVPAEVEPLPLDNGLIVFAYGETTGHKHSTIASPAIRWFGENGNRYVASSQPIIVTHDEHDPVTLEPETVEIDGIEQIIESVWQVGAQVEYQRGQIRRVID